MGGSEIKYIENGHIKVGTKDIGGEWCSLIHNKTGIEHLWQGDPKYWGRSSCILFPTIGKLKGGQYHINDQTYRLNQHGFLRNELMSVIERDQDYIVYSKKSDAKTRLLYPFDFEVRMIYELDGTTLSITYEVYNNSNQVMPFSIGAHPAFNVPIEPNHSRSDYQLQFDQVETLRTMTLDEAGLITENTRSVLTQQDSIAITDDLFDHDALILSGLQSTQLSLIHPQGQPVWTFDFSGFPYLGIWSKNQKSPFVCIEPWHGIADLAAASGHLYEKIGIETLDPQQRFACTHSLTLH